MNEIPIEVSRSTFDKVASQDPYFGLERVYRKDCLDQTNFIFFHPNDYGLTPTSTDARKYNEKEAEALEKRDFETRIFITQGVYEGRTTFIRSHFTDNHKNNSLILNLIRDYIKATHGTKNFTAAKSSLSEMLTMSMECDESDYYSFALTVASGLSNMAKNTSFERHEAILDDGDDIDLVRRKLCLIMNVLFERMESSNYLSHGDGSNIFRLVHCSTVVSKKNYKLKMLPLFSFLLQVCLTVFVVMENVSSFPNLMDGRGWTTTIPNFTQNLILAILTFLYSFLIAKPSVTETKDAFKLYRDISLIQLMDFGVNSIIPIVLLFSGFLIILLSESFIESVLNTAALLFIPKIDDELPQLLGYDDSIIYKRYFTFEAMRCFDCICLLKDEEITEKYLRLINDGIGVQFSDFYLTNWPEQGATPGQGIHFQPYQVREGLPIEGMEMGHQLSPSTIVTEKCLIRKIVWSYTTGGNHVNSSKPRIGYLRLEMLNGRKVVIGLKTVNKSITVRDVYHSMEGVFIITTFQMSGSILRLRVCGSYDALDFEKAFDYYSLWYVSSHARKLLKQHAMKQRQLKRRISKENSYRTYEGFDSERTHVHEDTFVKDVRLPLEP